MGPTSLETNRLHGDAVPSVSEFKNKQPEIPKMLPDTWTGAFPASMSSSHRVH